MSSFELPVRGSAGRAPFRPGIPWKAIRIASFYLGLLALWQLAFNTEIWPESAFPSPEAVFEDLKVAARDGALWESIVGSMRRMAVGYSLSIVVGLVIGISMGSLKWADETVGSLVVGLQSLPSITWFPLALLWFGPDETAITFVVLMGSVNSIAISSSAGVRGISPLLIRASNMFGGPWWRKLIYVIVPAMLPSMVQGLKLGWSFAWRSLLAAELLFRSTGLGQLLTDGRERNDVSLLFAVMLVIIVIGMAMDRIVFGRLEGWVNERWGLGTG